MRVSSSLRKMKTMAQIWRPRPIDSGNSKIANFPPLPEQFQQRIVLSDGSTFLINSTSPRPVVKLAKDTRNSALWNPQNKHDLNDDGGILTKFNKKFGDFGDLEEF